MDEPRAPLAIDTSAKITTVEIRTPNNTITLELIQQLRRSLLDHRENKQQRVYILTGAGWRLFCPGLHLGRVLKLDRPAMEEFMQQFCSLCRELFSHPKPTIARLSGHALAGGCILASCCDFRLSIQGTRIGLTPLNRFLPVPAGCQQILAFRVGSRHLGRVLLRGLSMTAAEANRVGWLDWLGDSAQLDSQIESLAASLGVGLPLAFAATKRNLLGGLPDHIRELDRRELDPFLDCWFATRTRAYLESVWEDLNRGRVKGQTGGSQPALHE